MSLQIWLPLNGNLNNQGLSNITFTGTPTWRTSGKIGASALNLSSRITFNCPELNGTKYFSVCFWGMTESNPDSTANWMDLFALSDKTADGATAGTFRFETGYGAAAYGGIHWHDNATNAIINGSYTYNTASEFGQWHHICVTVSDTQVCSYYDGILKQTHTSGLGGGFITGAGWIGETTTRGGIQDIRIYDHALSKKEVEEISKGLVCHYRLNDKYSESTINLCNGSTNGTQASANSPSSWGAHKYYTILVDKDINDPIPNNKKSVMTIDYSTSYGSGGGASVYPPTSFTVEPSTTYIYSRYIKPSDDFIYTHANFLYRYEYASGGGTRLIEGGIFNKNNIEYIGNGWYRCWGTFTTQSTTAYLTLPFYTYPGKSIIYELSGLQLEKKDHMTPYVEHERIGIVYDSSGYNHNGIINGSFNISNNTARYSNSFIFNGSDNAIKIPFNDMMGSTPIDYTISVWIYKTSIGTKGYQTILGGPSGFELEARNGGGTDPQFVGWNWGKPVASYAFNEWTLFTFVRTASDCKIYVNGEYQSAGSTGTVPVGNYFIGAWSNATAQNYEGQMSDFRIYTTALTADQIKELYNTSVTIDKNGNVYAREVIE